MAIPVKKYRSFRWFHTNDLKQSDAQWLHDMFSFHELDLEDCLQGKAQQPKHEIYKDHNFLILHFVNSQGANKRNRINAIQVNVFISPEAIVTITNSSISLIEELFSNTPNNKIHKKTGDLLHEIIDRLTDQSLRVIDLIGKRIDQLDEELIHLEKKAIEEISLTRRDVIIATTTVKPMLKIFADLEVCNIAYLNGQLQEYWSNIKDHHGRMIELLSDYSEMLHGLADAFDILLTHRNSQTVQILTVFSVIMLPLTVITGLYGMNVMLPGADNSNMFAVIIIIMVTISITMLAIFRHKKWI